MRQVNGVNEYTQIDPNGPQPPDPVVPGYDVNGNLTTDPTARNFGDGATSSGQTYTYDHENRLRTVRRQSDNALQLELEYDALGRRVLTRDYTGIQDPCGGGATPVETRHVCSGIEAIEEYARCGGGEWLLAREFVWGRHFPEPIAMIDHTRLGDVPAGNPEVLHYLPDSLGGTVALTNSAGEVVERYVCDPYGATHIESPGGTTRDVSYHGNPFCWTGQRYDAGVGLYHRLFRSYSARLGRWQQRDPLGCADGINLYLYAGSFPLILTAPLGTLVPPSACLSTRSLFPNGTSPAVPAPGVLRAGE